MAACPVLLQAQCRAAVSQLSAGPAGAALAKRAADQVRFGLLAIFRCGRRRCPLWADQEKTSTIVRLYEIDTWFVPSRCLPHFSVDGRFYWRSLSLRAQNAFPHLSLDLLKCKAEPLAWSCMTKPTRCGRTIIL
jgi:hypothetical protein